MPIHNHARDIVKLIYTQYSKGMSKSKIVKELNDKGYKLRNNPFKLTGLTQILNNIRYTGKYYFDSEIEIVCPQIIPQELFDKCIERQKINKKIMEQKIVNDIELY